MRLLIVNFHYIRDEKPERGIYPRTPNEFREQILKLGGHYDFVSQQDLEGLSTDHSDEESRLCLVTIDDGLKEQLQIVDFLNEQKVPAVFFVNTGHFKTKKAYEVHKLHLINSKVGSQEIYSYLVSNENISDFVFPVEKIKDEWRYDDLQTQKIKYFINHGLTEQRRAKMIDYFFSQMGQDEYLFCQNFYMSISDLKGLAKLGMLGSHTRSHRPLASLSRLDALDELSSSRNFLKEVTGVVPQFVSYPYGGATAINADVANMAKETGYRYGVTMNRGVNSRDDLASNPLLLKRVDTNDAPGGKLKSMEYAS